MHLQELVNAGKLNRESIDLLLILENQLCDMLASFYLRIMNSCDEFSTTTNLLPLPSQFSLPCLPVAFKENITVSSHEYFIHCWGGGSLELQGTLVLFRISFSFEKMWHHFPCKEAGRLSLMESWSEVNQRGKKKDNL